MEASGHAREAHIIAHCIRKDKDYSNAEPADRVTSCRRSETALGLIRTGRQIKPLSTTRSTTMRCGIWRALLRITTQQPP